MFLFYLAVVLIIVAGIFLSISNPNIYFRGGEPGRTPQNKQIIMNETFQSMIGKKDNPSKGSDRTNLILAFLFLFLGILSMVIFYLT